MNPGLHPLPEAPWGPIIGVYFILAGMAAGTTLVAEWVEPRDSRTAVAFAWKTSWMAMVALSLCGVLLIVDLGRPARFFLMLTRFSNPGSAMSMGAKLIALKGFLLALYLYLLHRRRSALTPGDVDLAPGVTCAAYTVVPALLAMTGLGLAAYPAILLARTWFSPLTTSSGAALLFVTTALDLLPIYDPIPDHQRGLSPDQLIMISFKWNVHNAHPTMQSRWLQEIVHSNPAWLNPATAAKFGLQEGDCWVELTSFRPRDAQVPHDDGSVVGTLRTRVHLTEGVHPLVIAVSHNNGRWVGGPIAARGSDRRGSAGFDVAQDPDSGRIWWQGALSVAQNNLIPIYPDPRSGQQAWHDTVVRLRKVTA
jgi:hypothetical protein